MSGGTLRDVPPVPVGDIQLYDSLIPEIYGGDYAITVSHDAPSVLAKGVSAVQRFTVSAPQFGVDPGEIAQRYPPDGSTGRFDDVLPFVVLSTPELPWERRTPQPGHPWLAVLVLAENEITGGTGPTLTTSTSVAEYLALTDALVPPIIPESDVAPTQPCSCLRLPAATFTAVMPRLEETRYLAHVRVVNTADKPGDNFSQHGAFSVVVANRFPAAPPPEGSATRNIVHLVSIEGLGPWLVDDPVFTRSGRSDGSPVFGTVALLSLASWTFQSVADPAENFAGLTLDLLESE